MLATLGSEAQVVTAALDLFRAQGEQISQVVVIHTSAPAGSPVAAALQRLVEAFAEPGAPVALRLAPVLDALSRPLADVDTPAAAEAAFRLMYREALSAKRAGLRLHLSIAGGRKTLAVYGMACAQLLFDEDDRLWHLYSSGEFLASRRLHPAPGDDVHLIPIPVIRWGHISPVLTGLSQLDDPFAAAEQVRRLQLSEKLEQARSFILGSLTASERRAAALLVQEGLSDQEIAERLTLSPRTVEQQLRSAYKKASDHWGLAAVGRAGLVALLGLYYSMGGAAEIRGKPA